MAAVAGDLLRVVDFQSYLGEEVINVYYYKVIDLLGAPDGYFGDCETWFEDNVLAAVTAIQSADLLHTHREWRNLSNNVDLFSSTDIIPGTLSGTDRLNSFTSLGFELVRSSLLTRSGYKRYAGLMEADVNSNSWVGGSTRTDAIESALTAHIMVGIIDFAVPSIIKRPIPVPAVGYVANDINVAAFRGLGTQNTRKPGRGV